MHYLYKITNISNNKIYIGQTIDASKRWGAHLSFAKNPEKTGQYIHRAMAKYGSINFIYEIIASCKTQEDANEVESLLISQYNSRDQEFGYNIKPGGNTAPHSEETKQKLREATLRQIEEKGHPAQGTKRTDESRAKMSAIQQSKDNESIYNEEVRQRMSEAHIGHLDTEETKQKKSESATLAWGSRVDYSRKCEAPGCDVHGKVKYKIINNIRYCNKHGLRMLRYGRLDVLNA